MTKEEQKELLLKEVEKLHTAFTQSEIHCMINADVIAIRGEMALSLAKDMVKMVDKKSKAYQIFSLRVGALESLTKTARVYSNNTKIRIKNAYGDEKIDENVGNLSNHVNTLYSMDAEQIVSIMNCTEMVKGGHIPTYLNLDTIDYQRMAQKTCIPYEYVAKIVIELQNFVIDKTN